MWGRNLSRMLTISLLPLRGVGRVFSARSAQLQRSEATDIHQAAAQATGQHFQTGGFQNLHCKA